MVDRSWRAPVYTSDQAVVIDGSHTAVLGHLPGPAGVSTVTMPDLSTWQVDHANPAVLVGMDLFDLDPTTSPLLLTAFGGDEVLFILEDAVRAGDDGALTEVQANRPGPAVGPQTRRSMAPQQAGRLILLADLSEDPNLHPLARLAAALQGSNELATGRGPAVLESLARTLFESAARLANEVDGDDLGWLGQTSSHLLREALSTAREAHAAEFFGGSGLAAGLERLRSELDRSISFDVVASRIADDSDSGAAAGLLESELSAAAGPAMRAQTLEERDQVDFRRTHESLVEVTVSRDSKRRWAELLRRDGLVLLGQGPLGRRDLVDVAEVVVPADVLDSELVVRIRDESELDHPARSIDKVRKAISAGREAARSDRLGDVEIARARWERCAQLWRRASDPDRADLAHGLSRMAGASPSRGVMAADRVAENLAEHV